MSQPIAVILGCGPAGLLAAHAASLSGYDPVIYSKKIPSRIGGAQFLHRAIPEITSDDPDGIVTFTKNGDPDVYAKKVYGDAHAPTSWNAYAAGQHPIWNMHQAYHTLWGRYANKIYDAKITSLDLERWAMSPPTNPHDVIFSTIPRPALCMAGHEFIQQSVWITYEALGLPDMEIVYSGEPSVLWYRRSSMFGYQGTEYPMEVDNSMHVKKPLSTDCDCHNKMVTFLGRYGRWEKGVLIHHAFEGAMEAITSKSESG